MNWGVQPPTPVNSNPVSRPHNTQSDTNEKQSNRSEQTSPGAQTHDQYLPVFIVQQHIWLESIQ